DLVEELAYMRQLLAGQIQTFSIEKRYLRQDGSAIWANLSVSLVRDSLGQPNYLIGVV
ncbi:MAG TPA: diguanylate cyclase, partial [Cyanobacteria bacterium UBA11148]|nr:diguanylate cyclase [Cyanobacteria bacterium UBA11148]